MFGCASFEGTNPAALALAFSFLHHNARAKDEWQVSARHELAVSMDQLPVETLDMKAALSAMPPLVKGYLRLGAMIGDGAVVDKQFGTTDIMVVLPVSAINSRYINHYGAEAERYAS